MKIKIWLTAVLSCFTAYSAWAGAGITALENFLDQVKTAQGEFSQTLFDKNGKQVEETSQGSFVFARPGKFLWNTNKPYPQQIVSNGTTLWLFDPDLQQVTIKKLASALTGTPAAILFGSSDLSTSFRLQDVPAADGLSWVMAHPKTQGGAFAAIRLGFTAQGTIAAMELMDNFGQKTVLRFSKVHLNVPMDAAQFVFHVPEGVDVFEDKTQLQ